MSSRFYYTDDNKRLGIDAQKDFLARGGEKSIYVQGKYGWAIYHDPSLMIPLQKITELAKLDIDEIVKPKHPIIYMDRNNNIPIGHAIDIVDGIPLVKFFITSFQKANNLKSDNILEYVKKLQQLIDYTHSKGCLMVDINDLNFLVNMAKNKIYAIDTNSYQTPHFPATAINPKIFDHQCNRDNDGHLVFTENSDWYSFGILALQLICGINPYQGGYKPLKGLSKPEQMEQRIKDNISIFNKDVTLPPSVRSLDLIPNALKEWMYSVYEKGQRSEPPTDYEATTIITVVSTLLTTALSVEEIISFDKDIIDVHSYNGHKTVVFGDAVYSSITKRTYDKRDCIKIGHTKTTNRPIGLCLENRHLSLIDFIKEECVPISANADGVFTSGHRTYVLLGSQILELELHEIGTRIVPSLRSKAQVLQAPNATKIYQHVVIQNIVGQYYVSIFPDGRYVQIRLEELDGYRIIDAKYENHVLMVIGEQGGKYSRFVFRFNHDFTSHDAREPITDITYSGLNFTVNSKGVCVAIVEDDEMEVFTNLAHTSSVRIIKDNVITNDMRLFSDGSNILIAKDTKLFRISLK